MSKKRIVFVSRLDSDCSLGAFLLCEIAPNLANIYEDIEIYIVGGGEEYEKIRKEAEQINQEYNRELILTVGYSSNPSEYFTENMLFVGVSRSAIEAMAHSIPVILLGNEGYLGMLDKSNLKDAIKTNLTCRNSKMEISPSILLCEIRRFFDMTEEKRKSLCNLSLSVAKKYFSMDKCAAQTIEFYQEIIKNHENNQKFGKKRQKIALCGYYGRGNFGDEAILCEILKKIEDTTSYPPQISLIKSNSAHKIIPTLTGAELFIFGGGSLLQNSTSNKSLLFYLSVIFLANALCKRKIMLANGIGPINKNLLGKDFPAEILQSALNTFDFISVRDKRSQAFVKELIPKRKIHLIHDPATIYFLKSENKINPRLTHPCRNEKTIKIEWGDNSKKVKTSGNIVYIPCGRALEREKINSNYVQIALKHLATKLECGIILAVLSREDEIAARKIAKGIKNCKITTINSRNKLISMLKNAKICITQRYHGALYSLYCKAPTLILSNDPKAQALCDELGAYSFATIDILGNIEVFLSLCEQVLKFAEENSERIAREILSRAEKSDKKLSKLFSNLLK